MVITIQNEEFIRQHYKFLKHIEQTEIRAFHNDTGKTKSLFVDNEDFFVNQVKTLNLEGYDVYVGINERYKNSGKETNVKFVKYIFSDLDFKDNPNVESFLKNVKELGFKISASIKSGGGLHYYIALSDIYLENGDSDKRQYIKQLFNNFKTHFKKYGIDTKVYDLSRIARVWGTWNYSKEKLCELENIWDVTDSDKFVNHNKLIGLPIVEYKKSISDVKHYCGLMEWYFQNRIIKKNMSKNDVVHKNMAQYLKKQEDGQEIGRQVTVFQGHSISEFDGWWKRDDIQFSCGEMRNWTRQYFPDIESLCFKCQRDERKILKFDDNTKDWYKLKQDITEAYKETNIVKIHINKFNCLKGVVGSSQYGESKQSVTMMSVFNDYEHSNQCIKFLDESPPKSTTKITWIEKPIYEKFYVYTLSTDNDETYTLLSDDRLVFGSSIVYGTEILIKDKTEIGNTGSLSSSAHILLVHSANSEIIKYQSVEQLYKDISSYDFTEDIFFNALFAYPTDKFENRSLRNQRWFEWMMSSWLLSSKHEGYPLHMILVGKAGTGKTRIHEIFRYLMQEKFRTTAETVTMKSLIPSYGNKKEIKMGAALSSSRLWCWDEGFRIIKILKDEEDMSDELTKLNNILLHEDIVMGSGLHKDVNTRMKSKTLMTTNPPKKVNKNIMDYYKEIPETFLDRFMIYIYSDEHIKWIRRNKNDGLVGEKTILKISSSKWISIFDFFNNVIVKYDNDKLYNILDSFDVVIPEELENTYNSRYKEHHAPLLLNGIVKTRCLLEKDIELVANGRDYKRFEEIWTYIINSWNIGSKRTNSNQKEIIELIKSGLSAHDVKKEIDLVGLGDYNLKYLLDNNVVKTDGNNYIIVGEISELGDMKAIDIETL